MNKNSKIFIAGHNGLVGSAIKRKLEEFGYTNLICKTRKELGWTPKYTVQKMCSEMVASDIEKFKKQEILKKHGYEILNQYE